MSVRLLQLNVQQIIADKLRQTNNGIYIIVKGRGAEKLNREKEKY